MTRHLAFVFIIATMATVFVVGCSLEQLNRAEEGIKATTQVSSDPIVQNVAPPWSQVITGIVTAAGMVALAVVHQLKDKKTAETTTAAIEALANSAPLPKQ